MGQSLLQNLPGVDTLLQHSALADARARLGHAAAVAAARAELERLRGEILCGALDALPSEGEIAARAAHWAQAQAVPSLRPVVNATGVLLHTNLGRAPLADSAVQAAMDAARQYSTLEYNAQSGTRGSRQDHVAPLLCALTGAEAAMVVNNNAAAVLLMLSALAKGREVIVSRGELVEIGGSFRVPDIMALSGATLREVGTTNRTHPDDYTRAIGEGTAALLKVHTSNYRICGFTAEASLQALVDIGRAHNVPVYYDLGSGCLLPQEALAASGEPSVAQCMRAGVDVLAFSGDKLLGGPQAGILLGKADKIAALRRHPLARALRVDKMTLAALEATLRLYLDPARAQAQVPVLRMLTEDTATLRARAEALAARLADLPCRVHVQADAGPVGGGTTPGLALETAVVAIETGAPSPDTLAAALRAWSPPIVARIAHDRLLLDARTLSPDDFDPIAACLQATFAKEANA